MIVFFGPIGAGKSMQGQILGIRMGWQWVSTGAIFRASKDPEVQEILAKGQLISSEKTYEVLAAALDEIKGQQIILDGFPRKKEQAEWLIEQQASHGYSVDLIIIIDVPTEEIVARLSGRGRADDAPEVIKDRLAIYFSEVDPILNYLKDQNVPIVTVDGLGKVGEIHDRIMAEIQANHLG